MTYLRLVLNGVMQQYAPHNGLVVAGSSTYYKTEKCPTINAMTGMIGAALGYPRHDERLEILRGLDYKYRVIKKGSIITDYQTVRPFEGEAFTKVTGGTTSDGIIKTYEYLQDYAFEVFVGAKEKMLKEIYDAFQNPVFPVFLGKKSCFPMEPIAKEYVIVKEEEIRDAHDCP